jgi:hypothetical protein
MKAQLGKRLFAELMGWDHAQATEEFAWLRTVVEYKYDHYQGYNPGSRFFVNLLSWMAQFDPADRGVAYDLIRTKLIFISQREMHHLVGLTVPRLRRDNRRAVADDLGIPMCATWGHAEAERRVKIMNRRTVFIGLSDGAKTDVLRRVNEGDISNEQIVAATEISPDKWKKIKEGLVERFEKEHIENVTPIFERICLVDDFTASGSSLIRKDKLGKWKGKVPTFVGQMIEAKRFGQHVTDDCVVQIHHYIGTAKSRATIDELLEEYRGTLELKISFKATYSMVLDKEIVIDDTAAAELVRLLEHYYDDSCEDEHTGEDIWFGYKQCGLPVVLDHNTPNNSVALLWASASPKSSEEERHVMKPLFPRKKRHVEHGQSI